MLLSCAVETFLSHVCAGKVNETPNAYRKKLAKMMTILGDMDIGGVTRADIERFRVGLLSQTEKRNGAQIVNAPLSPWYVRNVIQTARHFWRWCYDEGLIPANPAAKLKPIKVPRGRPKAIRQETFDKLLEAATRMGPAWERARNVALLMLLWDSGGRISEILRTTVDNLDLSTGVVTTVGKGDQLRYLIANEATLGSLNQWLEYRAMIQDCGVYVFVCANGKSKGKPLTRSGVNGVLRRLAKTADLPKGTRFNPHSFRHGFVMRSLDNGARLDQVSQLAGHSSIRVTADIYNYRDLAYLRSVHDATSPAHGMKVPAIVLEDIALHEIKK